MNWNFFRKPSSTPVVQTLTQRVTAANKWRDTFNPLRNLDIAKCITLLEQFERGEYAEVMWTMRLVEKTSPDCAGLIDRRVSGLVKLNRTVKIIDPKRRAKQFDKGLADDQVAFLTEGYERIDNVTEAIEHAALATFRGFSHMQPQRTRPGLDAYPDLVEPNHLECLDQWNFVRDGIYGDWFWNPDTRFVPARSLGDGARLPREGLIIREAKWPLTRIALLTFVRSNLSEKDWDAFIETYGLVEPDIIAPPSVSDQAKLKEFQDAVDEAAGGGGAYPNGTQIVYPSEGVRGNSPYEQRGRYLSEKFILAGTGGKLTMLASPTGIGGGASDAHDKTFDIIAQAEALKISEVFQRDFDKPRLAKQFPGKPILAYFELAAHEEQDVGSIIEHNSKLQASALRIKPDQLQEKTGYTIESIPGTPNSSGLPPPAPGMVTPPGPAAVVPPDAGAAVADTALNGAQVASLLDIVSKVAAKQLPVDTAVQVIAAAFPTMAEAQIRQMLAPLSSFTPALVSRADGPDQAAAGQLLAKARLELPEAQHKALAVVANPLIEIYRKAESEGWTMERIADELKKLQGTLPGILSDPADLPTVDVFSRLIGTAAAEALAGKEAM